MTYRWMLREVEAPATVGSLQRALNDLPEALARALVLRGIETLDDARHFFRPERDYLHDPFLMADMPAAAERVAQAVREHERVLVYGDYDVDGTTSTALMTHFLRARGIEADFFIPDRTEHGYGLCEAGLDYAAEQGAALVIALDCGVTALDEAAYAKQKGLDLIICDHHTAPETLPDALAVLDPKRPDCGYPFKELSGCGVGFKLMQAVLQELGRPAEEAFAYLDLLAISIASDIVPVDGENRVLLHEGLERLRTAARPGLRALAQTAEMDLGTATATNVVFRLGPRINAAGRLDHASRAVDLLLAESVAEALPYAQKLETLNTERRAVDRETAAAATKQAERQITSRSPHALVLYDENWHPGVIGIVASRVAERFHKAAILFSYDGEGTLKGSARSIRGVNIYEAIKACEDLVIQFGGHDYAAGLSIREDDLAAFRERFGEAVGAAITPELLDPVLEIDAPLDLAEIGDVSGRFWAVLRQFAPFGPTNLAPVFKTEAAEVSGTPRTVGQSGKHLKFAVRPLGGASGDGASRDALDVIGFGMGDQLSVLQASLREGRPLALAFTIEENTWRGRTTLQLKAKDVRLAEDA